MRADTLPAVPSTSPSCASLRLAAATCSRASASSTNGMVALNVKLTSRSVSCREPARGSADSRTICGRCGGGPPLDRDVLEAGMTDGTITRRRLLGAGATAGAGALLTRVPGAEAKTKKPKVRTRRVDVCIVGGGFAGLTAAYRLH